MEILIGVGALLLALWLMANVSMLEFAIVLMLLVSVSLIRESKGGK